MSKAVLVDDGVFLLLNLIAAPVEHVEGGVHLACEPVATQRSLVQNDAAIELRRRIQLLLQVFNLLLQFVLLVVPFSLVTSKLGLRFIPYFC
jgi:hypothetical protein